MRQMKQRADGGLLGLRQKTPDVCGGAGMSFTLAALNPNQTSTLVLPLVSASKKLTWVQSNQMNLQLDGATELEKAFDRFPYLKRNQTAALAQRCSLHPDQVRVWFMVQRLRYGISWDYDDILEVRRKLGASQGKEKLRKGAGGRNTKMRAANVKSERKIMPEQPGMEETDRKAELQEEKGNTQEKRKRLAAEDKVAKKSRADEGVVERAGELNGDEVKWESSRADQPEKDETPDVLPSLVPPTQTQAQTPNTPRTPVRSGFEGQAEMEGEPHAASKNPSVADVGEAKVPVNVPNNPVVADGYTRSHFYIKSQSQLKMMKGYFSNCQYPGREDYDRLAAHIGLPRPRLVQWFADMRYYVKKLKPTWMTQEQHKKALDNINYRQCLNTLTRVLERKRREGHGEQQSVQAPPEEK